MTAPAAVQGNVAEALAVADEYGTDGDCLAVFDEKDRMAQALITLAHAYRQIEASL